MFSAANRLDVAPGQETPAADSPSPQSGPLIGALMLSSNKLTTSDRFRIEPPQFRDVHWPDANLQFLHVVLLNDVATGTAAIHMFHGSSAQTSFSCET
jgi:hypothetical protein